MTEMRKALLVAAIAGGQELARRYLQETYDLHFVSTMQEAKDKLRKDEPEVKFNLVIAGVHFDDSRAFELLRFIRKEDHLHNLPFIIVRTLPAELPDAVRTAEPAARLLGTCAWLDNLYQLPEPEAKKLLCETVQKCLTRPVKKLRVDSKE